MAKASFGEYGAFTNKNSVRFTKNNIMIGTADVPEEVRDYLVTHLGIGEPAEEPKQFAPPTEEEKKRLREESLQVAPELQVTPEKLQEDAAALTESDFTEGDFEAPEEWTENVIEEPAPVSPPEDFPPIPPTIPEPSFLETVSIHTAPLESMVHALYERFGIYTVFLQELPRSDEINPLTGEQFTNYHLGIAYQAAISAKARGILDRKPEEGRRLMDEGRTASANFRVDPVPQTMADARQANSYEFRTSARGQDESPASEIVHVTGEDGLVHAVQRVIPAGQTGEFNGAASRYDKEEDERIVEPQMGKQVIRPNW